MNWVRAYADVLRDPRPLHQALQALPAAEGSRWPDGFLFYSVLACAFFFTVHLLTEVFVSWYRRNRRDAPTSTTTAAADAEDRTLASLPGYVCSSVHHVLVVPVCMYLIATRLCTYAPFPSPALDLATPPPQQPFDAALHLQLLCFGLGYIVVDTIVGLQTLGAAWLIHHVAAVAVAVYGFSPALLPYYPHIAVCELSGIFFNVMWFSRKGLLACMPEGSRAYYSVVGCFVAAFVVTRCVNLPFASVVAFAHVELMGIAHTWWVWCVVLLMQYFWLYQIVRAVCWPKSTQY
eukprot:gnl/Spiro4/7309_TR3825_c0_g1_i1.p1 gnl/Spiro4/7309_TR3825_c0_g1~~gnl/Spiro4/7309_TR3825_c0_g1_i1.p1  ORF type:complete len:302 (-),score=103.42 gnl/Spiro4/7309_TR3825_c0_g1_i1:27-899(-)